MRNKASKFNTFLYSEFLKKVFRSCLFLQPLISKSAKLLDLQLILIGPLF